MCHSSNPSLSTAAVFSSGGDINISADNMVLGAGIDASGPTTGAVTLDTVTKSQAINLGSVIGDVREAATALAAASEQMSATSQGLARGTRLSHILNGA